MRDADVQNPEAKRTPEPEISYFGLQAYMGTTKHMGGFESSRELGQLCHIDEQSYVLDVGCGAGATACYLAKELGIEVVGVDLRMSMVARAEERATREGVKGSVEFRVADAQALPFADNLFDAVLCESVATFIKNKQGVVEELSRVARPGGYVGLNEEIWIKSPLPGLAEQVGLVWDIESEILTAEGWQQLLESAGLQDVVAWACRFDFRRESSQLKRYGFDDYWRMFSRTISLYISNPAFREYMKDQRSLPRDVFEYLGYGLFAGRKGSDRGCQAGAC
jgi:ubiquinone/menaquinone biosynthesis C-methylase UbiE